MNRDLYRLEKRGKGKDPARVDGLYTSSDQRRQVSEFGSSHRQKINTTDNSISTERQRTRKKKKKVDTKHISTCLHRNKRKPYGGASSKVIPLHLERLPILQIPIHNLEHPIRKPHAQQGKRNLGMPMNLSQLEKRPRDQRRVLFTRRQVRQSRPYPTCRRALTVISVYSAY